MLFNMEASKAFAVKLTDSVLLLDVVLKVPDWADKRLAPRGTAMAVAVLDGIGKTRVLTAGPIATEAETMRLRLPDGTWLPISETLPFGDGALVELVVAAEFLTQLTALPADKRATTRADSIIFTPLGISTPTLHLARGSVAGELSGPAANLLMCDIPLPNGTPLITAEGNLLGVNFRPHPRDVKRALAVTPESLRDWLRPEGPPYDPPPETP
ncbi:MAG: hypothetical protein ACI9OJ_004572 [Myxococcota bacterium]